MSSISRRGFLGALGGAVLLTRRIDAQQIEGSRRMCWISAGTNSPTVRAEAYNIAFLQRLGDLGFVEGRNLTVEIAAAGVQPERMPEIAMELARRGCDVFIAPGSELVLIAAEKAARDTPIVMMANDYDPVATGHIASLAQPGGRITGVTQLQTELPAKRLELLKEFLPRARRVAVLADVASSGQLVTARTAAKRLGLALKVTEFTRAPYDYERAFADSVRAKSDAELVLTSGFFVSSRREIPALAVKHRLPSIFCNYLWAEAGGLLSYGPNFVELYRRAADKTSQILKGVKPADIPVEEPTALEMVINLKTLKALGLTIPQSIRLRADRVIE